MRVISRSASLISAALLLAAGMSMTANAAQVSHHTHPIRLRDDVGQTVVLSKPATRIVAIEPSNAEIVLALGLKSRLVGVDSSSLVYSPSPYKEELRGMTNVGSALTGIDVEKVVATRPNLVIASEGIKGLSSLKQFHIPVLILEPSSIAGIYHDIALVGKATATGSRSTALIAHLKSQVARIKAAVSQTKSRPTVFIDLGGLYTAGPGSFINALIDMAGGRNVGATLSHQEWPLVTDEQVVHANPQEILLDGGTTIKEEDHYAGFSAIAAVKTHHVYELPTVAVDTIDQPSPGFVEGLKELVHFIHPALKVGQ